ncbi:MAG: carboxypeptidase-like regulatory domain-containing protein [Acidobacteriota bacterium]
MSRFARFSTTLALATIALGALPAFADGTIRGQVTASVTGFPLESVRVCAFGVDDDRQVMSTFTAEDGSYELTFPASTVVVTAEISGYQDEVYDDVPCLDRCPRDAGTPIVVADLATVSNIDFALDRLGRISGQLTDAATGVPLDGSSAAFWRGDDFVGSTGVRDEGRYESGGLPAGEYFVVAMANGFQSELHDGLPCPSEDPADCRPEDATLVTVANDTVVTDIDFRLDRLGALSGTVVDADGAPIFQVQVRVWDADESRAGNAFTDLSGQYLVGGLEPGSYTVSTTFNDGYVDELYDDMPCFRGVDASPDCSASDGTPVRVELSETTTGIDFALDLGGSITGRVRAAATGEPLSGIDVNVSDADGNFLFDTSTDAEGRYTLRGLPTGQYLMLAIDDSFRPRYFGQLYDHLPCARGCSTLGATPIDVTLAQTTTAIDFDLLALGHLEGQIVDATSGVPIAQALVEIRLADGGFVDSFRADDEGRYVSDPLEPGEYLISAFATSYLPTLHPDIPCPGDCDVTDGEPVRVDLESGANRADIAMPLGGIVSGQVVDTSGRPLAAGLGLYDAAGSFVRSASPSDGAFRMDGLAAGDYTLTVTSDGYLPEVWNDRPCPVDGCDPSSGDPIRVTLGRETAGVDFELTPLGRIAGRVIDVDSRLGVRSPLIRVYDAQGFEVGRAVDNDGDYVSRPLRPGNYFVTVTEQGYVRQVFGGGACDDPCDPTTGTPIPIDFGTVVTGVDFELKRRYGVIGRVVDAATGFGVADIEVTAWDATNGSFVESTTTAPNGVYIVDLDSGVLKIATNNGLGADDLVWPDAPCPGGAYSNTCDVGAGETVTVFANQPIEGIDFALDGFEASCQPSSTALCLNQGRFRVQATWRDADGVFDFGRVREITGDTGYFWFFDEDNVEVVVKVLDACTPPFDRYWVFAAGLTDVEVGLIVTDTLTEETRTYENVLGTPFEPVLDTDAFATCATGGRPVDLAPPPTRGVDRGAIDRLCSGTADGLCLSDQRFRVEASWRSDAGSGTASAEPLTDDTGYFWFFGPDNVEVVVKVLDACVAPFDRFWVFAAGLTDVELTLRVIDTETGQEREYTSRLGDPFQPVLDTDAFATCSP